MRTQRSNSLPNGFTLIEVLLSITLMTISLTGVNLLITTGLRSSVDCRDRTKGLCLAQSVVEALVAGEKMSARPGVEVNCDAPNENWLYRWSALPSGEEGLAKVIVEVRRESSDRVSRVKVRWAQLVQEIDLVNQPRNRGER